MILKTNFVLTSSVYIKVKSLYQHWKDNRISTSKQHDFTTLNQRQNLTLKQRWFWVDSKKNKLLKNWTFNLHVERITVLERQNNASLSTLNKRRSFMLNLRWFCVDSKQTTFLVSWKLESLDQRLKGDHISTSKQGQFTNVKSTSEFDVKTTLILG